MAKTDVVSPAAAFEDAVKNFGNSGDLIADLFDRGYAVEEAKAKVFETRNGIRESLRNLTVSGMLTPEQEAELVELYPPRERKGDEEQATAQAQA